MCYMNTHELHLDSGWIALARHQQSISQLPRHQHLQVHTFTVKQLTTMKRPRSSSTETRGPRTDMYRPGIEPGPPRWEASTLEKSLSNSLLIAIRIIYIWLRNHWRMLLYFFVHKLCLIFSARWTRWSEYRTYNTYCSYLVKYSSVMVGYETFECELNYRLNLTYLNRRSGR